MFTQVTFSSVSLTQCEVDFDAKNTKLEMKYSLHIKLTKKQEKLLKQVKHITYPVLGEQKNIHS